MSNFDFMNNKQFLAHPSCALLYKYAKCAEAAYSDHEKCALKVRFILEQFCIFVSELKGASYPERTSMLGQYWGAENEMEFLRTFGHENATLIKRANTISRSYLHSGNIAREDIYPEMLRSVYVLLLWLYKELGFRTPFRYCDYSIKRIPAGAASASEPSNDIHYSSEEQKKNLKKLFPNCNTDQLCSVVRKEDRYIITDISGRQTESLIQAEKYQNSEKERMLLKEQLEQAGKEFEAAKRDFLEAQSRQETLIQELKDDRALMAETHKESLQELGDRYNLLLEKYEELIPLKEKKLQMQQQIKDLIREREDQEKAFSDTHETLLGEIANLKKRLASAQQDLMSMGASARESQQLIRCLEEGLAEKEKELSAAQALAKKKLDALQAETLDTIQKYKDKANSLEIILSQIMEENTRFREMALDRHPAEEAGNYLQLVNQGISGIEEGYALYRQNPNEQQLREYLLKVKRHYENRIENLEKALKEKEEKLAEEQRRNNALFEALWEETERSQIYEKAGNPAQMPERDGSSSGTQAGKGLRRKKKKRHRWLMVFSASLLLLITLASLLRYWDRLSNRGAEDAQKADVASGRPAEGNALSGQSGNGQEVRLSKRTDPPEAMEASKPAEATETSKPTDAADATTAPGSTDATKNADTTKGTDLPDTTDAPQKTPMPKETDGPDKTAAPFDGKTPDGAEPPEASGRPAGNDSGTQERHADQVLAQAHENLDWRLNLPGTVEEIPGVSQDLLDDMATMRKIYWDLRKVVKNGYGEDTEEYHSLGNYKMLGGTRTLYQIDSLKASKFAYCSDLMVSPHRFHLAVEPDAVISGISYDTPLAEVESVLGEAEIGTRGLYNPPTDFSESLADGEYSVAVFYFNEDEDSEEAPLQAITFVYNEERDQILDYVYIYEHVKK